MDMEFVAIATEQTTAITDLLLAGVAFGSAFYLRRQLLAERWKTWLWTGVLGLLCVAALLGAIAHGIMMSESSKTLFWQPLNLALGLMVALFCVAVIYDIWGKTSARRMLPILFVVGLLFFGITLAWPDSFLWFIVYEVLAMLFALGGYLWLTIGKKRPGAGFMTAGVCLTILAAGIQTTKAVHFTLIWTFDHNGVYHLVQIVAVLFFLAGLRKAD
jgi:hypothetical protein